MFIHILTVHARISREIICGEVLTFWATGRTSGRIRERLSTLHDMAKSNLGVRIIHTTYFSFPTGSEVLTTTLYRYPKVGVPVTIAFRHLIFRQNKW